MVLSSSLRSALYHCTFAISTSYPFAQSSGAIKATPPTGVSYSTEGSGREDSSILPAPARREADLRTQLSQQPDSPSLLYALTHVQRQENNPHASLDTYTRAAKLQKPAPRELRSVALDYVLLNDYDDAIHWLEVAVAMDPSDPDVLYSLGRCYYSKSRFVDAGKLFERVLPFGQMI